MRYAAALVALMAAFVAVTLGAYFKVLSGATEVTLRTPSAGLQLGPRADVKVRGVIVGEVSRVRQVPGGAELLLALDEPVDRASTARLLPKTLFGEKYVDLIPPARPTAPVRNGDVLTATGNPVETIQLLDRLLPALRGVRPDRLSAALTQLATTLDGRGAAIGTTIDRADAYLTALEPHLPAIRRDITALADVLRLYGEAAPDLLRLLNNGAELGQAVTANRAALDTLTGQKLVSKLDALLKEHEPGIVGLQHVIRPALGVTARYAPAIPCSFRGLERLRPRLERVFAGGRVRAVLELVRPARPYQPGSDAPRYADTRGPSCYGLPNPPVPFPGVAFDDGTRP
ncbi:MCE family protein [Nonomuraea sp. NPDC050663]|uniref:MCE family protein n=1 Tax=Nonomuraea sp. NPDC050663 TaxID=3364370 RepID=UPI0037ABCCDF